MTDTDGSSTKAKNVATSDAIDYSSPYHLHPSDHPGMVLVSQKLIGDNFPTWRHVVKIALAAKNKLCFVDGSLDKPESPASTVMAWERCSNMVISWLLNSLNPDIANSVSYAEILKIDSRKEMAQGSLS